MSEKIFGRFSELASEQNKNREDQKKRFFRKDKKKYRGTTEAESRERQRLERERKKKERQEKEEEEKNPGLRKRFSKLIFGEE